MESALLSDRPNRTPPVFYRVHINIALLSPEIERIWSGVKQLTALDKEEVALVYQNTFADVLHPTAVVALTHPAYRHVNVKYRRYGKLKGEAAEQALVRDAITKQFLND